MNASRDVRKTLLKVVPWPIMIVLLSVTVFSGLMTFPNASAAGLPLTVGNVKFSINDFGVITNE
ncbi:MAG: hypothetical protein V3U09_08645, partial [Thermoplasmata archaeon]